MDNEQVGAFSGEAKWTIATSEAQNQRKMLENAVQMLIHARREESIDLRAYSKEIAPFFGFAVQSMGEFLGVIPYFPTNSSDASEEKHFKRVVHVVALDLE